MSRTPNRAGSLVGAWRGFLILSLLATGCAKVQGPTGGPEDKSRPLVLHISPDSGAVGVRTDTIRILFSKKMDQASVRDWLFLSPPLPIRESRWQGSTLTLVLETMVDTLATYQVLLGAEVTDLRRNSLGPWTSPFCGGTLLDDGVIEGKLLSRQLRPAGAYLYVWPWSDSLPREEEEVPPALRIGQAGRDGSFRIQWLPRNLPLKLCAFYDARGDRRFDVGDDLWGSCESPILLGDSARVRTGVQIYLVLPDEPGSLGGTAADSICLRLTRRLHEYRREADSLGALIEPRPGLDSLSTAPDTLLGFAGAERPGVDTLRVRARLAEIENLRREERGDSILCAQPVIVRLFESDTSMVSEVRGGGAFEFREVPPGIYLIRAFRDRDANGLAGPGEPAGRFPFPVELRPGRALDSLDFRLVASP